MHSIAIASNPVFRFSGIVMRVGAMILRCRGVITLPKEKPSLPECNLSFEVM